MGNKCRFCPTVCPSVCPSVAYIANNSRTQRPSVPKFGRKVSHLRCDFLLTYIYYASARRNGAITVAFVRPSVCPSVAYIANNSRTQRPSVPKFGRKVSHLRCDSHTSFRVKWSKVRVRGGRGHIVSAEPGGHTAC